MRRTPAWRLTCAVQSAGTAADWSDFRIRCVVTRKCRRGRTWIKWGRWTGAVPTTRTVTL